MADDDRPGLSALAPAEGRKFGLTVGAAFLALAGILLWRGHLAASYGTGAVGGALVVAGLVIPGRLGPIQRAWMGMARAISKVTTPLFMGLVYFLVLTPAGLLRRRLGGNPLRRGEVQGSYWVARSGKRGGDLRRQF